MWGRIYRLNGGGKFYIGSTTLSLEDRLREHKVHCRERLQTWREENPEKVKAQRERWKAKGIKYARDPETERERLQTWREANPEKYAEQKRRSYEALKEKRRLAAAQNTFAQ